MEAKLVDKYLEELEAIFEGEVVSLGEKRSITPSAGKGDTYEDLVQSVKFKLLRTWKVLNGTEITVQTDVGSSCQFIPAVGDKYVVYAFRRSGILSMNYCSVGHFDEKTLKVKYGQGKVVEHPVPSLAVENSESLFSAIWNRVVSWFSS